jgi:drug/metabolite transporter (DMT)-like permease
MRRYQADLLLLLIAAIWGLGFVFQKTAMAHVEPLTFIAARTAIAALVLMPIALRESSHAALAVPRRLVLGSMIGATLFFLGALFQQTGIVTATVTNTGFLTALYIVLTPLIAWGFDRKRPDRFVWPAIALAFAGSWLLGGGTLGGFSMGDTLVAVGAIFWAAHIVATGKYATFARPYTFTCLQFAGVAALAGASAAIFEHPTIPAITAAWIDIAFVGVLSSALTFTILAIAMRHTPPAETAIIVSTETLFAAFAAYLLLGERLSVLGWLGAGMIMAGALVVQLGPQIRKWRTPAA